MTGGAVKIDVLTKAVVPHRETIDAVANGISMVILTPSAIFPAVIRPLR